MDTTSGNLRDPILAALRRWIAAAAPGVKLPSENELCRKYHVSRKTSGAVLNRLAAEGLIERRRGSGSFTACTKTITLLLPFDGFLDSDRFWNNKSIPLLLDGLLRAARELNLGMELLSIAPKHTCDPYDIDYSRLNRINASSRVVVMTWFLGLFEFLQQRGARVAYVHQQDIAYGYRQYTHHWLLLEVARYQSLSRMMAYLHEVKGCRRILLVSGFILSEKDHALTLAYREYCRRYQLAECMAEVPTGRMAAPAVLSSTWQADYRYDAVILRLPFFQIEHGGLRWQLHIDEKIPVGILDGSTWFDGDRNNFIYSQFDWRQIGCDAAVLLASDAAHRRLYRVYEDTLFDENGHPIANLESFRSSPVGNDEIMKGTD